MVAAIGLLLQTPQQQMPVFRTNADLVVVYPLVTSDAGRLITSLNAEDFTILDNGKAVPVTTFSNDTQPITAVLLLDMSASMDDSLVRVRESAARMIDAMLPVDRLRVGTFGSEVVLSPLLTSDKNVLRRVLREELWPGGSTPLWNALGVGMQSLSNETGRRTIVVVTDGVDTSNLSQAAVIDRAIKGQFMTYAIALEGKGLSQRMIGLITDTGGGYFDLKRKDDLGAAFVQVAAELRHQYLVGFTPADLDGKAHTLEVRINTPGMRARAARSFVSPIRK